MINKNDRKAVVGDFGQSNWFQRKRKPITDSIALYHMYWNKIFSFKVHDSGSRDSSFSVYLERVNVFLTDRTKLLISVALKQIPKSVG